MALAGMTQEETNVENRNHCKRIAEEVEAYANGEIYRCPECGECFNEDMSPSDDDNCVCPGCKETVSIHDLEQQTLYDYFSDCLDIEYRVSGRGADDLRSVCIMIACGGPNIYIDTATKQVELYWWTDRANYPLSYSVCNEIDDWADEYWRCM